MSRLRPKRGKGVENIVAKEGLKKDDPAGLGAGGPEFKSRRPDQNIFRIFFSLHNVMLIASQKPNASYVAGFRTWNELGRFVKKGEKGILILAPIVHRRLEDAIQYSQEIAPARGMSVCHAIGLGTGLAACDYIPIVEGRCPTTDGKSRLHSAGSFADACAHV
jgi:N-terminal domain of anti-restriction factor ArdC